MIARGWKRATDGEIFETAVSSSGDLCGHGAKVHGVLDDIAVTRDQPWINRVEEEGVVVFSAEASETRVSELIS